jgi:hypothetical protein
MHHQTMGFIENGQRVWRENIRRGQKRAKLKRALMQEDADMPLTVQQRRDLLRADRSQESGKVAACIIDVLNDSPDVTLYDCELALRDAAAHSYIVANGDGFRIVFGMQSQLLALMEAGIEAQDNARILQSSRMAAGPTPGAA